jgi:hypothetical protein
MPELNWAFLTTSTRQARRNRRYSPAELGLDAPLRYRLLRAQAAIGLLVEDASQGFVLTDKRDLLRSAHPQSLMFLARLEEDPQRYALWKQLPAMIPDGKQNSLAAQLLLAARSARAAAREGAPDLSFSGFLRCTNAAADFSVLRAAGKWGWTDENMRIDYRLAIGESSQFKTAAAALVGLAPDVVVTQGSPSLRAIRQETSVIKVVFTFVGDPAAQGFVESLVSC